MLLALDTSTSAITAALYDGLGTPAHSALIGDSSPGGAPEPVVEAALSVRTRIDVRGHAEWLAVQVSELLAERRRRADEVSQVVAGEGPGPFTGLRVGLVTAETFAFATDARYAGVCSLDALAFAAARAGDVGSGGSSGEFLVATDARRKEVYWATYVFADAADGGGVPRRTSDPAVAKPADLPDEVRSLPCIGRGAALYPEWLPHGTGPLDVDAGELARLAVLLLQQGRLERRERARPLYLRRPDAVPSAGQASARSSGLKR